MNAKANEVRKVVKANEEDKSVFNEFVDIKPDVELQQVLK